MTSISIRRMTNRFRMPAAAWQERERLGRIFDAAMFDMLERAVIDAGLDPRDEICIRRVSAFVRMHLRANDHSLARSWSDALARAIRDAARASRPDVVFYRSRAQALADVVMSVGRGDLSRTWAWAKLGLWSVEIGGADAARQIMLALIAHRGGAIGVLAQAGHHGAIEWLVRDAPAAMWSDLARAVLLEMTGSEALLHKSAVEEDGMIERESTEERFIPDAQMIARVIGRSTLAIAFECHGRALETRVARSIAILALAEAEPWRFQNDSRAARLIDAIERVLVDTQRPVVAKREQDPDVRHRHDSGARQDTSEDGSTPPLAADDRVVTEVGGLVFLTHVLAACNLPRVMADDPALEARDLRFVLHQLAMLLTGCEATDPAALAFAGLRPIDTPPDRDQPPIDRYETEALSRYAQEIVERVAALFADEDAREPLAIVKWVCERRADVVADPGWIELRFQHQQADTSIRRRGLDLNPDFVPWLGVFVRFAYV